MIRKIVFLVIISIAKISYIFGPLFFSKKNLELKKQWIFIIGPPRSGTTITYQKLCKKKSVSFISNSVNYFFYLVYIKVLFGMKLNVTQTIHETSSYGSTLDNGLLQPSEAGYLWRHWRSSNLKRKKIILAMLERILVQNVILVKNLYLLNYVDELKLIIPNVKFYFIERDSGDIVRSILVARKTLKVPQNLIWGVSPNGFTFNCYLTEKENVTHQVNSVKNLFYKKVKPYLNNNYKVVDFHK